MANKPNTKFKTHYEQTRNLVYEVSSARGFSGFLLTVQLLSLDVDTDNRARITIRHPMGQVSCWMEFHGNAEPAFVIEFLKKQCATLKKMGV